MTTFQIDFWEIFLKTSPDMYMKMPSFVIKWLANFLCQEKINAFFRQNSTFTGIELMEQAIHYSRLTICLKGTDQFSTNNSRYIFASNHPLGGLDGICLSVILGKRFCGNIRCLVNDILYFIKPWQNIFVPIKQGVQSRSMVKQLNEAFDSSNQIIIFPAGFCSRKIKGQVIDLEWKKMFISKSIEYQRNIVPVYFDAVNSCLFYTIANIRRRLGLKFNIELFLLSREMFKAMGSTFTIYFGKPIPWQTFNSSKTIYQWSNEVRNQVYAMKFNS